jgi:hypothetical protein
MSTQENVPDTRAGNDLNHCLPATVNERSLQTHGFTVETTGHSWIKSEFEWHDEVVAGEMRLAVTRPGARHQQVRIGLAIQDAGEVFDFAPFKHVYADGGRRLTRMCTVTFIARQNRYARGMNRDEKHWWATAGSGRPLGSG